MTRTLLLAAAALALHACSPAAQADETPAAPATPAPAPAPQATAQTDAPAELSLTVETIRPGLHVLFGAGGNVGVSTGEDGIVLIDDKFSRNAEEILYRARTLSRDAGHGEDVLFVLNTHLHGDHTGSNPEMKEAGAMVMAHDNVRARMGTSYRSEQFDRMQEAKDPSFFPVVTFSDRASLHFNGVTAHALHVPAAHTDGDSLVHFVEPDVIHMGDSLFLGMFPLVDVDSGGNMQGMIEAHDTALAIAGPDTVIIPGHGPITDADGLREARDTLQTILDRVRVAKDSGKSLAQIRAEGLVDDMSDMSWFIDEDGIVTAAWRSLGGEL